jgi:dolichol-phosphate mannosyltransferase
VLLIVALITDKLFFREVFPGYVSTIAAIVLIGGVQIIVTGVASLYIGRILAEVQSRPLYVVRERHGDLPELRP